MTKYILKLLGEVVDMDYKLLVADLLLREDLELDDSDIDEVLDNMEDYFGIEFEDRGTELTSVEDLVLFVKESL